MRTLERNKQYLWLVEPIGKVQVMDRDGLPTGEFETQYSTPKQIKLALYPTLGDITKRIFGDSMDLAYLSLTDTDVMSKDALLFYNEPTSDFDTNYDLRVAVIKRSLNHWNYGLEFR
jgi:hypothetical protein